MTERRPKPLRRRGVIRKTVALYREGATPEILHRAVKTSWQAASGGGIAGLGGSILLNQAGTMAVKIMVALFSALGAGVTAFITNLLAEVDLLIAERKGT